MDEILPAQKDLVRTIRRRQASSSAPAPPVDKNGKVQLGRLRSATDQDGFDTPLCKPALGPTCVGGGGCDLCCAAAMDKWIRKACGALRTK